MESDTLPLIQLDLIEEHIGKIIELKLELEKENKELKERISILEAKIISSEETEKRYLEEKNAVQSKLDHILQTLEDIEKTQFLNS